MDNIIPISKYLEIKKMQPDEICQRPGKVKSAVFYEGVGATLRTPYGDTVIMCGDKNTLEILVKLLMPLNFKMDHSMTQKVSLCSTKEVSDK